MIEKPGSQIEALETTDLGMLAEVLKWADNRFGPIREVAGFRLVSPEPSWYVCICSLARAPVGTWFSLLPPAGAAGASLGPSEALQRALGEAVERYSALSATGAEGAKLTPNEAGSGLRFPICAPDESCPPPFRGLDPDVPLTHVTMRRLVDKREVPIPAAYVHLGFRPQPPEPLVTLPISTGLAFHSELHRAIWNGLCEVAERDALMLAWWQRIALPEIACDDANLPAALSDRVERLRRVGLRARLFDMTSDFLVPSVFCVVTAERYPYAVTGAACREDPEAACAKAMDEAVSCRVTLSHRPPYDFPSLDRFEWVQFLEHHSRLYADQRMVSILNFLLRQARPPIPFAEFSQKPWWRAPPTMQSLSSFASELEAKDLTVLWTEVTAREALDLGHVVKVVVPEMLPLSQDHNTRWLATPRLLRASGLKHATASAFNPFPHPFA